MDQNSAEKKASNPKCRQQQQNFSSSFRRADTRGCLFKPNKLAVCDPRADLWSDSDLHLSRLQVGREPQAKRQLLRSSWSRSNVWLSDLIPICNIRIRRPQRRSVKLGHRKTVWVIDLSSGHGCDDIFACRLQDTTPATAAVAAVALLVKTIRNTACWRWIPPLCSLSFWCCLSLSYSDFPLFVRPSRHFCAQTDDPQSFDNRRNNNNKDMFVEPRCLGAPPLVFINL